LGGLRTRVASGQVWVRQCSQLAVENVVRDWWSQRACF